MSETFPFVFVLCITQEPINTEGDILVVPCGQVSSSDVARVL